MVRSKAHAKKQQKHGVDFKKIKRKLGRKLPPPKNATDTEIKSKAIILPEQSVAAEKAGLALSKKGLTLKELLQHSSHHNTKVRKDALLGIRDLFTNHPAELQSHKFAVIQKLRERISDDDKLVRETFYQLFKTVIFPGCKEDNRGPVVSLLMAYIFSAMANSAIDVRLMAFKFFELVVQYYPPTFSLYADKILENYKDIIQKNQFYVQEKGKLKVALSGLVFCLSLLPCNKSNADSRKKDSSLDEVLHAYGDDAAKDSVRFTHIFGKLKEIIVALINCFQDFIPLVETMPVLDAQSFDCIHYILRSIGYAIKFSSNGNIQEQCVSVSASEGFSPLIWDYDMASLFLKKLLGIFPLNSVNHLSEKGDERYFILNSVITEIFLQVTEAIHPPADLCDKFLEFIENTLLGKITKRSNRYINDKNLLALLPSIPKLVSRVEHDWRDNLLQAFTQAFKDCKPDSPLKLAFISAIEEMIIPKEGIPYLSANDSEIYSYQLAWVDELPLLLNQLGHKHPSSSQAVLQLLLRLGQHGFLNASRTFEDGFRNFYCASMEEGEVSYGPFVALPKEVQELSLCCLYYFNHVSSSLLTSIVLCCLYPHLEPAVLYRIVEVLQSAYRVGYIAIEDHISFLVTLIARFKVFPEKVYVAVECDKQATNRSTFKALTRIVCSCLSEMGDSSLVFQILEKILLEQNILKPILDNTCAMLRIICAVDSKPTKLSEHSIITLSEFLPAYLIHVVHSIPEENENPSVYIQTCRYYLVPCFFLFDRSTRLVNLVLSKMGSMVSENVNALLSGQKQETDGNSLDMIRSIVSVILLMHGDVKVRRILSLTKSVISLVLQNVLLLQSSEGANLTVEGKHAMRIAGERLRIASESLLDIS